MQAHIIRSLLLEHEIETDVIHQNASTLWAGGVAACVLAVRDEDMEFVYEALHAPREIVPDESVVADGDFQEDESGPVKFRWDFFLGTTLVGICFAWVAWLLGLLLLAFNQWPKPLRLFDPYVTYHRPIELADLAVVTGSGALGGLLSALAFVAARWVRPDGNGRRPPVACFALALIFFPYTPPLLIVWLVLYLSAKVRKNQ